jgi:hypothetical protein
MASVINYIGHIWLRENKELNSELNPSGSVRWDGAKSYSDNARKFSIDKQLRMYLDQLFAIAFYHSFYGKGWNVLIDEYVDETLTNFEFGTLAKYKQETRDYHAVDQMLESVDELLHFIKKGTLRKEINIDDLLMFRELGGVDVGYPLVEDEERKWIKPYLIWLNSYWLGYSKVHTATEIKKWFLPSFKFFPNGSWEKPTGWYTVGLNYHSMSTTFCAGNSCQVESVRKITIYDYLARFNFAGVAIETIIGKLGDMCLSFDVFRPGTSASQKVCAVIRANVLGIINFGGAFGRSIDRALAVGNDCFRGCYGAFEATKAFVDFLSKTYGATLSDTSLVARLFKGFAETKQQKESAAYLAKLGGSASADELHSFKEELGSLEALQFISQNNALLVAQSQEANPKAAAEGEETEKEESETKEDDSKSKETESDNQNEEEKEDDSSDSDEEQSGDAGEDDTSEEEDETDGDSDQDDGSGQAEESSDTSTSSDDSDMPSEDEQPNTSDPRGFKFKVSNPEAETTDSVMFREEMDHFLSNILANPPEDLSPQTIQTLTSLHRYWLHTLSIGTIMGILGSCGLRLPSSLKQLTTKCTE